ncbi:MAG: hypothetical protein VX589_13080 [Myxococcota bacterium]|nr:hypothetical protein [Myxococcota bacterium]
MRSFANFEHYPHAHLIWQWLEDDFGIVPSVFDAYRLWHRPGRGAIWIADRQWSMHPETNLETVGMQVTRRPPPRAKPSTYFAQKFGQHASVNVVDLPDELLVPFFRGEYVDVPVTPGKPRYCIVRLRGQTLGCGWISRGQMRSQLPRFWTREWGHEMPIGTTITTPATS